MKDPNPQDTEKEEEREGGSDGREQKTRRCIQGSNTQQHHDVIIIIIVCLPVYLSTCPPAATPGHPFGDMTPDGGDHG